MVVVALGGVPGDIASVVESCRWAANGDPTGLGNQTWFIEMTRNVSVALYVVALIAVVVGVDLLFFRNRFWERLIVNIGIVMVFSAFYLRFMKGP
jgi:type IV secretory pathway VirB2 component (pilin)